MAVQGPALQEGGVGVGGWGEAEGIPPVGGRRVGFFWRGAGLRRLPACVLLGGEEKGHLPVEPGRHPGQGALVVMLHVFA